MKYFLLTLMLLFSMTTAYAEERSGVLPIRVTIIQCGELEYMNKACEHNNACCQFVMPEEIEEIQLTERTNIDNKCPPGYTNMGNDFRPLCIEINE